MDNLIGKQLGSFQIVARLGTGGMATVFKAYQPNMERYVALKVLRRHFSENPEFAGRFSQEARLIAQLEHPNILPVYDFGESDGYTYMAMRLVKGGSLSNLLKTRGRLDLITINRIIAEVGGALQYAHERNVIHRDLKPGNILMDDHGSCLLTDFGIAKLLKSTSHLTETGGILGTPLYISPEQGSGEPVDHRSDIYALGVVLYHMVVGDVPYKADTPMAVIFKHIHDPLPLPGQLVPDLPEPIERVIMKALAKNPDDRYATAKQFVDALKVATKKGASNVQKIKEPLSALKMDRPDIRKPDNAERASTKPYDNQRQKTFEVNITPERKSLNANEVKYSNRRKRIYGFGVLSILAVCAGAVWFYYHAVLSSEPELRIASHPSGALVYVDDEYVGVSPVRMDRLSPGTYKIRMSMQGYKAYEKMITLQKGSTQLVMQELIPEPYARLNLKSTPTGADVFIDSQIRGNTPLTLAGLPAGNREVLIVREGFEKMTLMVALQPGDDKTIDVHLKPIVQPQPPKKISNILNMEFVYIHPGRFMMGSPPEEPGRQDRESIHPVNLTNGFYLQTTEITVGHWRAFIQETTYRTEAETKGGAWFRRGKNWYQKPGRYWDKPGFAQAEDHPVTCISWNDVQKYIAWIGQKESKKYRLPTEAEWEFACRAQSTTAFSNGELLELKCGNDPNLDAVGWYCGNSNGKTHPVARKSPNRYGLYDMHGNVWEWCQDWFAKYPSGQTANPLGPDKGKAKVRRGGAWGSDSEACRSACRGRSWPNRGARGIGFRLVIEP